MRMQSIGRAVVVAASVTTVLGGAAAAAAATGQPAAGGADRSGGIRHVLLISVDGLHQQDLHGDHLSAWTSVWARIYEKRA